MLLTVAGQESVKGLLRNGLVWSSGGNAGRLSCLEAKHSTASTAFTVDGIVTLLHVLGFGEEATEKIKIK